MLVWGAYSIFVNKLDKKKVSRFFSFPRCHNGGTCIDGIDEYSCTCPPQITGMTCECLMLDNEELDCNFTSDFTTFVASTTEMYQTTLPFSTTRRYTVEEYSSTVSADVDEETEKTDSNSIYDTNDMTTSTMLSTTTVDLTTANVSQTTETNIDSTTTTTSTITSTIDSTSDVSQMLTTFGSTKTTEYEITESSVASETTSISSTTTEFSYKSTTDYNSMLTDTTLSNSFFTDYPTVKTTTDATIMVDNNEVTTVGDHQSPTTTETTTEYLIPTTLGTDKNVSTVEPKTLPACLNKLCQNGGTCVPMPDGAKVR